MKRWMSIAIIAGVVVCPGIRGWATVNDAGTQNPFELGAGARALALSGAYPAIADDSTALFWNPAGLARVEQTEVSAMHINLLFDTPYDYLGVAYPLLDWGTFAVGAVRLATSGIITRDESSFRTGEGEGSYDLREYLFGYGREWFKGFNGGAVVKVDQQRLLGDAASGVGVDLGAQYHGRQEWPGGLDWEKMTIGIDVQNVFGSQLRLGADTDVLPLNVRSGLAYTVDVKDRWQQKIILALGADKSTWREWCWRMGLEYQVLASLALRGGLNAYGWSAGVGAEYAGVGFDYALSGQELGVTHRFSLTYRFGPNAAQQREERERRRQEAMDREATARAEATVKKIRDELTQQLENNELKYSREKQALLAQHDKRVSNAVAKERQKSTEQKNQQLAREYFKTLHYFNGLKDYMNKNYKDAVTEFETVAKFDPKYLELAVYLERSRQLAKGQFMVMSPETLKLYYRGIDYYMDNKFNEAIGAWKKILITEPSNLMVMRNIEEAENRLVLLNKTEGTDLGNTLPANKP
jgi:tetratricopeptide (TPR) repeat protein